MISFSVFDFYPEYFNYYIAYFEKVNREKDFFAKSLA